VWENGSVPFAVKLVPEEMQSSEFLIRNFRSRRIRLSILQSRDGYALVGSRMRNEFQHDFQGRERGGAPVDGNERKELLLDHP
jgi:hypothetical protein